MKEVYELDVYRLSEDLSDIIWYAFDIWSPKVQKWYQYHHSVSSFEFQVSASWLHVRRNG